jgi:hypothetical protein
MVTNAPASICVGVCAFSVILAHPTGIRRVKKRLAHAPRLMISAVVGPAIPEACTLIFHRRVMSSNVRLLPA